MSGDSETLFEMMLSADRFCSEVESAVQDLAPSRETEELRLKLGQSRTLLSEIRKLAFYARAVIDFKLFRTFVMIESSFTYLLISR